MANRHILKRNVRCPEGNLFPRGRKGDKRGHGDIDQALPIRLRNSGAMNMKVPAEMDATAGVKQAYGNFRLRCAPGNACHAEKRGFPAVPVLERVERRVMREHQQLFSHAIGARVNIGDPVER